MKLKEAKTIAEKMTAITFDKITPLKGGRNSHIFRLDNGKDSYAMKFFRNDPNNTRNRFEAETSAFKLFQKNSIQCVPKMIAQDKKNNCIIMDWINGEPVTDINGVNIKSMADFVREVHLISKTVNCDNIQLASDACLNGNDILSQINFRLERLESAKVANRELSEFLNKDFIPTLKKISAWSKERYLKNNMKFSKDIPDFNLTLSLVDTGFHNSLRVKDKLLFFDFEFFGRDDPVKFVADTLQHPGSILDKKSNDQLSNELQSIFNDDKQFQIRFECLYSLFGLKWCLIMLNPFQPGYQLLNSDADADAQRSKQLQLVKSKLVSIQETYKELPYVQ